MIAIQNDTQTHLGIQLMNKDTHKTPFIQFKMSDGISHTGRLSILLPNCVLTPEYWHMNGDMLL